MFEMNGVFTPIMFRIGFFRSAMVLHLQDTHFEHLEKMKYLNPVCSL